MAKIDSDVLIKAESVIPIELVQSSKNFVDIALANVPFLVTICVVICAATVTYRSNRKSVESQNKLSQDALERQTTLANEAKDAEHQDKISEFRHHWLQEVRGTAADLIKVIHECQYFTMVRNLADDRTKELDKIDSELEVKKLYDELKESYDTLMQKRADFYKHNAKLRLLFKNGDTQTKALFNHLDVVLQDMGALDKRALDNQVIESITVELQKILKDEWEITKKRSWASNT
ncbi:conserved hypothetical protein [Vibrio harveyi]|uniref:Uncharacterized protein n=1 Tax=Vibrio owensii CAIM 1854 = LMG 25443 TaxID=1229493 RepID=A0A0C1WCR5_9VIBR|nr:MULTISPECIES: hypothetical protein [Vibrio harveyi group]EJB0385653.1 hypothetical protein [Vibrio parahaemolyticus]EJG1104110.1 hypothetical protein [Vibrio parahaemolyticus]ELA6665312.1 hypothetical protein [Vibrio parahaemolyticus]KIF54157.1 hypothetical protein H735_04950 [Vibrio owensii CAIM 1854 = LMG 25443]MCG9235107.1 hypothetical protein [Vibrio harveyi]